MTKGVIIKVKRGKTGVILSDDGKEYRFNRKGIAQGTVNQIQQGRRVEFEPDGEWAVQIHLLDELQAIAPQSAQPQPRRVTPTAAASPSTQTRGHRFLNPYNFLRLINKPRPKDHVLGNCPPPPHDRYVGLTGRITCKVEAITPLFISDSHAVQEDANGHRTYRFFQVDGQPTLPASSLRGMVRSVFEAVTNSCLSVIHDDQLDYRINARLAPSLHPAVVTKLPNRQNKEDGEVWILKSAWIHRSVIEDAIKPGGVLAEFVKEAPWPKEPPFDAYLDRVLGQNIPIQAKIRLNVKQRLSQFGGKKYGFPFDEVVKIVSVGSPGEELQKPQRHQGLFWGYLKITGPNVIAEQSGGLVLRKHDERFFYWDGNSKQIAKIPWEDIPGRRNAVERYNSIRAHQKDPSRQQLPYVTYLQNEELSEGDLVWVQVENGKVVTIEHIGSVSIPKFQYKRGIMDLAKVHHPCTDYETLCPACRVFGWVRESAEGVSKDKPTAYAGRVRFSHGALSHNTGELPETTLAVLSTPKPTTTSFYLLNKGKPDPMVDYDTPGAQLRGRKFYRHHGKANPKEYRRDTKDEQNRTVRGALKPGTTFEFTVDFENLAPLELGALLFALELEEGLVHRLGYAKPFGFGSAKVTVEKVEVIHWEARLRTLEANAGWKPIKWQQYKQNFLEEMRSLYPEEFDTLLSDLRALLGEPPELPIHYPRPTHDFDPNHPQFEWFVGNKRRKDPIALLLAAEDSEGLPLIDKKGKEVP